MTYKIKIKAITINNNINMTDWKENKSYLHKKNDVLNETLIFQLSNVRTYDRTTEIYEELTQSIHYYALLNVHTYDGTTEQN